MKYLNKTIFVFTFMGIVLFVYLKYGQFLNINFYQMNKEAFINYSQLYPVKSFAAYFLLYTLVTGLSIPGANILTLIAGSVFGFTYGLLLVSFASTIGATFSFLSARYVFRDALQQKHQSRLIEINEGIEKEGIFYLFALRLIPIIPFFIINLVMGLTKMKGYQYALISQLGMLPGTIVYVNAGLQLSKIDSLSGIIKPEVLLSFVLLGILPILFKKVLSMLKKGKS